MLLITKFFSSIKTNSLTSAKKAPPAIYCLIIDCSELPKTLRMLTLYLSEIFRVLSRCWQDVYCKLQLSRSNTIVHPGSISIPLKISCSAYSTNTWSYFKSCDKYAWYDFSLDISSNLNGL